MAVASQAKAPQRARGIKRVEALLAAAEDIFAERGFGAVSMNAIAQRAGAPIGSLYQFFPSKEAIGAALSERYMWSLSQAWNHLSPRVKGGDWMPFAQRLTDTTLDTIGEMRAFLALLESQALAGVDHEMRAKQAQSLSDLLSRASPTAGQAALRDAGFVVLYLLKTAHALEQEPKPASGLARSSLPQVIADYLSRTLPSPDGKSG